ncbi:DUF1652 domain-containing protein [Pseudomonas syringae]|uniref:DUF1652 domain-containing protein n=1 Tax=Pseudomonas syringae TaxID=317 RepID=UPI0034D53AC8
MLSSLELRHVIETAFLPQQCECEISEHGIMSIVVISKDESHATYSVSEILASDLATSREIAFLISVIREKIRLLGWPNIHRRTGSASCRSPKMLQIPALRIPDDCPLLSLGGRFIANRRLG